MKGIILSGGSGTRLFPLTLALSKQILPIYDKPMIYYPLSVLMLAGIKNVLIISTNEDLPLFRKLFKTGEQLGMSFSYKVQDKPRGIADAFIVGEEFAGNDNVCLVLGDNVLYGHRLEDVIIKASSRKAGATIFGYLTETPSAFGVVEIDSDGRAISIEEKPIQPKSNYAVPGIYFYDNKVVEIAKNIQPSKRGELEITSVNEEYLKKGILFVEVLKKGIAWFDTGTHDSLLDSANYVRHIQQHNKCYVGCIEETAYKKGFIDKTQLRALAELQSNSNYGQYLSNVVANECYL